MADRHDWTELHRLGYIYAALASSDGSITSDELEILCEKLAEWNPDVERKELIQIVMTAVSALGEDKGREDSEPLDRSVDFVAKNLDDGARAAALDDLLAIAGADGTVWPSEGDLLLTIRKAWNPDRSGHRTLTRPPEP